MKAGNSFDAFVWSIITKDNVKALSEFRKIKDQEKLIQRCINLRIEDELIFFFDMNNLFKLIKFFFHYMPVYILPGLSILFGSKLFLIF